jgi:hypothetical protein
MYWELIWRESQRETQLSVLRYCTPKTILRETLLAGTYLRKELGMQKLVDSAEMKKTSKTSVFPVGEKLIVP